MNQLSCGNRRLSRWLALQEPLVIFPEKGFMEEPSQSGQEPFPFPQDLSSLCTSPLLSWAAPLVLEAGRSSHGLGSASPSPLLPLRLSLPVPTASSPACKAAYLVEVESRESQEEVRSASDFSYFGREPAELHVCKRSVGQEGVGASLWGLPREGARSGVWG